MSTGYGGEMAARILQYGEDNALREHAAAFLTDAVRVQYGYNFLWQGRPIIQFPQDIVALQELIWTIRPELIAVRRPV